MLAVASDCSMLRIINHYVRKEAITLDILCGGHERMLLQQCLCVPVVLFFCYHDYIMAGHCFMTDVISDQVSKGGGISIGTMQLGTWRYVLEVLGSK
jgi:hypothetical protein